MSLIRVILILCCIPFFGFSQSFWESDTSYNKNRVIGSTVGLGVGWSGSMIALSQVWYKDSWNGEFQFFNDGQEWLQMDKVGHAYTGYHLTRNTFNVYRWSGVNRNKSLLLGSIVGFGYLANLEIFDGFSEDWGFSWWDIAANTAGAGFFVGQEMLWQEQRLLMKFSASLSPYAQYRPEVLGSSIPERILKDYNGQTYWISASPQSFTEKLAFLPPWLALSAGYSVDGKLHGMDNSFQISQNGSLKTYFAQRQFLLSLDVDFERIPTKSPFLITVFKALNHLKVPFPTIIFTPSAVDFRGIYF